MKRDLTLLVSAGVLLVSCATSISVEATKLPHMDTSFIQRLAVMPFDVSDNSTLQKQTAQALYSRVSEIIASTGRFVLVSPDEISRLRYAGQNISDSVDGLFRGNIVSLIVINDSHSEIRHRYNSNTKKNEEYSVLVYDREVQLYFSYRLERARDGSIVSQVNKSASASDHNDESVSKLLPAFTLVQNAIDSSLKLLARDVAPYRVIERRILAEETTKNREVKARVKEAKAFLKEGSYRAALKIFAEIHKDTGSFASGYNAAIITEVVGDLNLAIALMSALENETGNPKAASELVRMQNTLAETRELAEKYSDTNGSAAKIIKNVSNDIAENLPSGAKLSLMGISAGESLLEYVLNGVAASLVGRMVIVDRQNNTVIATEKQFQASGAVDDDSVVSIGNELGVDIIVLFSINGFGNLRRLVVKAINVETTQVVYQNQFEI
ncbi:MAG: hypothetical protein LBG05_07675 [Treponema sp.]|jgi:hypothetical protein|nr:hypothetical protein [Treponema sp.]